MKVILLQEVKGRGGEGDVIDVARGYAVNYLYPRNIAVEATKGNLKQLEARRHNIEKRETQRIDTADKLLDALNEKAVVIKARVGEEGQLFGSVTTMQIAEAVAEQIGAVIDRKKIDLRAAIKSVGEHSATVAIYRDIKATLKVLVVDEKAETAEEAAAEEVAAEEVAAAEIVAAAAAEEIAVEFAVEAAVEAAAEEIAAEFAVEAAAEIIVAEAIANEAAAEAIEESVEAAIAEAEAAEADVVAEAEATGAEAIAAAEAAAAADVAIAAAAEAEVEAGRPQD
jgi:large subunit ribosomal protein L9